MTHFYDRDLESRPPVPGIDQMHLIQDENGDPAEPGGLVPEERIDFLRRGHDDVVGAEVFFFFVKISRRHADADPV